MAHINADRIKETTTTTGTGAITLAGAVVGFRAFSAAMASADTCSYAIVSATGTDWETGIGTFTSPSTLTRTTVQSSSNANAAVNFGAGSKDVFIGPIAGTQVPWNPVTQALGLGVDALNDVAVTSPTTNQVLKYDGTAWTNQADAVNVGTVTSVAGTGTVSGLTLTGTVTSAGSLVLGGSISTLNQNTTGNAATVTTNANLTGHITSVGNAAVLGSFSSAQLAGALSDETGSGAAVFANSPTLVAPFSNSLSAVLVTGPNAAGNSLTISAGSGVGVGAGGNIILQPGAQGTSGGDGAIQLGGVVKQTGTTMKFQNTTTDAATVNATPRISFTTDRSGTATEAYFWRGRLFVPNIGNIPTLCLDPGGTSYESGGYLGEGIGNVIGGGGIAVFASHGARLWCFQSMTGVTAGLGFGAVNASTDVAIGRAEVGVLRISNGANGGGQLTTGGSLSFPSSTTAISTSQNDLALTASAFQRINCTTASSITGIAPPAGGTHVDGRMMRVYNTGTANLTLTHNSSLSTSVNRFWNATAAGIILGVNDYAELIYDSTNNGSGAAGWRAA